MPRTTCIRLKNKQRESLERKRRKSHDRQVVKRATIVLMLDEEYPVADICAATGVCPATVYNTRQRWFDKGFRGLEDEPRPGRPPIADGEYLVELLRTVETPPSEFGYAFSVWTSPRLAEHLAKRLGKRVSGDWVSVLLRSSGYRWRRPKHTLRGKRIETEHRDGRKRLLLLEKGLDAQTPASRSFTSTSPASTSTHISRIAGGVWVAK